MTKTIQTALAKLETESKSASNNGAPSIHIYQHLRAQCEQDEAFAALVSIEANAFQKCLDYVMEKMKAKCVNQSGVQCVCGEEAEVYRVAEEYYRIGEAEFERRRAEKKAKEEAARKEREAKQKAEAAEKKKAEKDKTKKSAAVPKSNPKPEQKPTTVPEEPAQLSLF
jgi:hypothetical protein